MARRLLLKTTIARRFCVTLRERPKRWGRPPPAPTGPWSYRAGRALLECRQVATVPAVAFGALFSSYSSTRPTTRCSIVRARRVRSRALYDGCSPRRSASCGSARRRPTARSCTRASPSRSTATTRAPSGSFRTICCRASSRRAEWETLERGLTQRLTALNLFLKDIYHEGRILHGRHRAARAGLALPALPARDARRARRTATSTSRLPAPTSSACEDGRFVVLEDNLRVPSGVSYMLANREVMKRVFPGLFDRYDVRPIEHYGQALLATLRALAPPSRERPDDRAADAGRLQLGLLRARVPRARDGHRAGRRARPARPRQHRLHADDAGPAARRRDLSPRRRRLPRSAGVPAGLAPRRGRPVQRLSRRQRRRSPTPSAPASPTTRRSTPTCRRSSATTSARSRSCDNVETYLCGDPTQRQLRARATSTSWS